MIAERWKAERGIPCDADNVVVTPGAKPIMFFTMLALLEEGDEVLYPNPGFPIYESVANFLNARAVPLHLRAITGRGEPYENDYVFIFRIRDGRIAEVWENLDTLYLHTKLHS